MSRQHTSRRLNTLLWLTICVPAVVFGLTKASRRELIWRFRTVDLVDLVFTPAFSLIVLLNLHRIIFERRHDQRSYWLSLGLISMFLYGHAMHVTANSINTYSTEVHDYLAQIPPDTYELLHFFDEDLSHWILFSALFLLLGLWVIESDVRDGPGNALATGAIMGLGSAVAIIESSHPRLGLVLAGWLLVCSIWGARRARTTWYRRWRENPLAAYGVSLALFLIAGELMYAAIVGSFIEPSQLRRKWG